MVAYTKKKLNCRQKTKSVQVLHFGHVRWCYVECWEQRLEYISNNSQTLLILDNSGLWWCAPLFLPKVSRMSPFARIWSYHWSACARGGGVLCSRKQWSRKSRQVMEPTKMLLLPGEVSPHPNDPVEVRRLMFQTPGLNVTVPKNVTNICSYVFCLTITE